MSDTPEQPSMGSQGFGQLSGNFGLNNQLANQQNAGNFFNTLAPAPAAPMHVDVAGQLGGPHPDEQARVDEEQRQLMARNKVIRDEAERVEGANYEGKLARAAEAMQRRNDLEKTVAQLVADVAELKKAKGV